MNKNSLIYLCLQVLQDWRVIFVTVFLIVIISLANYVVRYTKKPVVKKPKKPEAPQPQAAANAEQSEEGGDGAGSDEE